MQVTLRGVAVETFLVSHIQTLGDAHKTQINNNFKTVSTPDGATVSFVVMWGSRMVNGMYL